MTRKYFEGVTYLQDARRILVNNLEKLNNKKFVEEFIEVYNAHICIQTGQYGAYEKKAEVTAEQYLEIARFIKALTDIRIGRAKIHLGISFKKGGINIHGDTMIIRSILKDAKFKWNPGTQEWYNVFRVMVELPEVPAVIEPEEKVADVATVEATEETNDKIESTAATETEEKKPEAKVEVEPKVIAIKPTKADKPTETALEKVKKFNANKAKAQARRKKNGTKKTA